MFASRWYLPTMTWVRLALVPALVFISQAIDRQYLKDFWHHLARGHAIVERGEILNHDIFTYTMEGLPFQDVNWLTQVLYYGGFRLGGLELVQTLNALLLALTFGLLIVFVWHKCANVFLAMAAGVFAFFGSWQVLTIRPQTFSLLFFVLVLIALDAAPRRRWLLAVPVVLIALWTNMHGAFPAGLLLVGCYTAATIIQAWRQGELWTSADVRGYLGCLAASALATLLNPYSWKIYTYVGITANRAASRNIEEWLPPRFELLIGKLWIVSLVLMLTLYVFAWTRQRRLPSVLEGCLLAVFALLAWSSVRHVVWWMLIMAPIAATLAALLRIPTPSAEEEPPSFGTVGMFGLLVLACVLSVPGLEALNPLLRLAPREPRLEGKLEDTLDYLRVARGRGNVYCRFEWGEYVAWSGYHYVKPFERPQFPIFMDARIEIVDDPLWEKYTKVTGGQPGWQQILDEYKVRYLILDTDYHAEETEPGQRTGLLPQVERSPRWQRVPLSTGKRIALFVAAE